MDQYIREQKLNRPMRSQHGDAGFGKLTLFSLHNGIFNCRIDKGRKSNLRNSFSFNPVSSFSSGIAEASSGNQD